MVLPLSLRVTTAEEARQRDAAAIDALRVAGGDSYTLMDRAGTAAAIQLAATLRRAGVARVAVCCGPGNNGGDGWVLARCLRRDGFDVRVDVVATPRSDDARRARDEAVADGAFAAPDGAEPALVDAIVGTGVREALRGEVEAGVHRLRRARDRGARIIALDLPSGLDTSTGDDHGAVPAHETLTFGTIKRGLLLRRELAGAITLLRIGVEHIAVPGDTSLPLLDPCAVRASIPPIRADAHKGTRGRVLLIGGAAGMAGAAVLAARAALRSGAGLVHAVVDTPSIPILQTAVPAALAQGWHDPLPRADALVIGPGLGANARDRVRDTVVASATSQGSSRTAPPVVLDADALNAFAEDLPALASTVSGRDAILTPHVAEAARLLGIATREVIRDRFVIGAALARAVGAAVVLKGTPTVIHDPDGRVCVAPVGSPVLATGGSGDLLAGILGALLAAGMRPFEAALAGVWAHGAAAEAVATTAVRGHSIDDVEQALRGVWHAPLPEHEDPVLARLPAVGE